MLSTKRIMSFIVATAASLSLFSGLTSQVNAASTKAYVKLIDQTDANFTIEIGTTQDANFSMFDNFEFAINIPSDILNQNVAPYAEKDTTELMFHKKTAFPNADATFNMNLLTRKYNVTESAYIETAGYSDGKFKYAMSANGGFFTTPGALIQITLPLVAPVATDTLLTVDYLIIHETLDGSLFSNYVKPSPTEDYINLPNRIELGVDGECKLAGTQPKLADFTALNVAIAAYEAKTEADYTAESWATAKAAYDTAKAIDQTTVTDQTVVDAATNVLNNAVAALVLKPVVVDKLEVKPDAVRSKEMPDGKLTFGFGGNVEITGTKSFTKLVFALEDTVNSKSASYTWEFDTAINASVSYGLNITGCPAGSNITATVTAE